VPERAKRKRGGETTVHGLKTPCGRWGPINGKRKKRGGGEKVILGAKDGGERQAPTQGRASSTSEGREKKSVDSQVRSSREENSKGNRKEASPLFIEKESIDSRTERDLSGTGKKRESSSEKTKEGKA